MIKKFKDYYKVNEDDSYDENEDGNFSRSKEYVYRDLKIDKFIDKCLHEVEKDDLKKYINEYIDNSPIIKSKNGWGFYGSDTNDDDDSI